MVSEYRHVVHEKFHVCTADTYWIVVFRNWIWHSNDLLWTKHLFNSHLFSYSLLMRKFPSHSVSLPFIFELSSNVKYYKWILLDWAFCWNRKRLQKAKSGYQRQSPHSNYCWNAFGFDWVSEHILIAWLKMQGVAWCSSSRSINNFNDLWNS